MPELVQAMHLAASAVAGAAPCLARLAGVMLLCPVLGSAAPAVVRLSVALACTALAGSSARAELGAGGAALPFALVRELGFGVALGLVSAAPFEAARLGGRLVDVFRGSSAEAALPGTGSSESALSSGMLQLVLAVASAAGGLPLLLSGVLRSFSVVPAGTPGQGLRTVEEVLTFLGASFSAGLAVGAPAAAISLAIDLCAALVGRVCAFAGFGEVTAPLKLVAGAAVVLAALSYTLDEALQLLWRSAAAVAGGLR